jgi:hypothetical protein
MDIDTLNGWVSFTAIAVNVQEEMDAFQNFRVLEGVKLACVNRLKVITTIAMHALTLFMITLHTPILFMQGELSGKNFVKIVGITTASSLVHMIFGICALPLTELLLQERFLKHLCRLTDYATPYLYASMKNADVRRFEKEIWELAETTRDDLLAEDKLNTDDLAMCDPAQIRFLIRATIFQMLENWEVKTSAQPYSSFIQTESFGKKDQSDYRWTVNISTEDATPKSVGDLGATLKQALTVYDQLSETQKEDLKEVLLNDTEIAESEDLDEEQEDFIPLIHEIGTLEHVITQCLLNSHKDFELAEKAQHLFMC